MLSGTLWLTIATVFGLVLGFYRELSLLDHFGASAALDGLIVALFLPEAIRIVLGGGALAAAMLPLWVACDEPQRGRWSATQTMQLLGSSLLFAGMLMVAAPVVVMALAPGMSEQGLARAADFFSLTIWCLPGIVLHAILATIHQAEKRFFLQGLAGVFFNGPAVGYLLLSDTPQLIDVAWWMIVGSLLMPLPLLFGAWRAGWRPFTFHFDCAAMFTLYRKLRPLIVVSAANQGVVWVERVIASMLGEGMIVLINFARKLISILSVLLMSLGQVVLSHFTAQINEDSEKARGMLQQVIRWLMVLLLPVVISVMAFAEPLAGLLPIALDKDQLQLLAWLVMGFAAAIPLAALNMLFARWCYAHGDTVTPTRVELLGMLLQSVLAYGMAMVWGILAVPVAGFIATMIMASIFVSRQYVPLPIKGFHLMALLLLLTGIGIVGLFPSTAELGVAMTLFSFPLTVLVLAACSYFILIRCNKGLTGTGKES